MMKRSFPLRALLLAVPWLGVAVTVQTARAQATDISSTVNIDADAKFEVREETYSLPDAQLRFEEPDSPTISAEMLGVVVAPVNASGPLPVAVFIHGQAGTCYDPRTGEAESRWPCAQDQQPVPSYRGYLTFQRFLAARGWITVSVSGNGVSGNIVAFTPASDTRFRTMLVEEHLKLLAAWANHDNSVPPPALLANLQPDLERLMLVGHSRGGAAANQVALQSVTNSASPWRASAQVLIGPVVAHFNPAPSVPTVVLLPGCDGDVTDLLGQTYIDRARDLGADSVLRSAVFIEYANHNFFNTEWDPSTGVAKGVAKDDASALFGERTPEGACRPGAPERLSGDAQRALGSFYIAAAGRAFVLGDTTVLPLLDGSKVCAGVSCDPGIHTAAIGGRRQPLLIPELDFPGSGGDQISVSACLTSRNANADGACITPDMPIVKERTRTPHFAPAIDGQNAREPSAVALAIDWRSASAVASLTTGGASLSPEANEVAMRVIVAPESVNAAFELTLLDDAGLTLPLGSVKLNALPAKAGTNIGVYWAQEARFPIDRVAAAITGFNTSSISSLQLTARSERGRIWLLDAWGYAPGNGAASDSAARFEISPNATIEGGQVRVSGTIFGKLPVPGEVYYYVQPGIEDTISVDADRRSFELLFPLPAETKFGVDIQVLGVKGMVAGRKSESLVLPTSE